MVTAAGSRTERAVTKPDNCRKLIVRGSMCWKLIGGDVAVTAMDTQENVSQPAGTSSAVQSGLPVTPKKSVKPAKQLKEIHSSPGTRSQTAALADEARVLQLERILRKKIQIKNQTQMKMTQLQSRHDRLASRNLPTSIVSSKLSQAKDELELHRNGKQAILNDLTRLRPGVSFPRPEMLRIRQTAGSSSGRVTRASSLTPLMREEDPTYSLVRGGRRTTRQGARTRGGGRPSPSPTRDSESSQYRYTSSGTKMARGKGSTRGGVSYSAAAAGTPEGVLHRPDDVDLDTGTNTLLPTSRRSVPEPPPEKRQKIDELGTRQGIKRQSNRVQEIARINSMAILRGTLGPVFNALGEPTGLTAGGTFPRCEAVLTGERETRTAAAKGKTTPEGVLVLEARGSAVENYLQQLVTVRRELRDFMVVSTRVAEEALWTERCVAEQDRPQEVPISYTLDTDGPMMLMTPTGYDSLRLRIVELEREGDETAKDLVLERTRVEFLERELAEKEKRKKALVDELAMNKRMCESLAKDIEANQAEARAFRAEMTLQAEQVAMQTERRVRAEMTVTTPAPVTSVLSRAASSSTEMDTRVPVVLSEATVVVDTLDRRRHQCAVARGLLALLEDEAYVVPATVCVAKGIVRASSGQHYSLQMVQPVHKTPAVAVVNSAQGRNTAVSTVPSVAPAVVATAPSTSTVSSVVVASAGTSASVGSPEPALDTLMDSFADTLQQYQSDEEVEAEELYSVKLKDDDDAV